MQTSTYFQRTLFYDQSPATEEYFLRVSEKLFEDDEKGSRMEARIFEHHDEAYSDTLRDAVKNPQLLQESGTSIEGEKKYTYVEQKAYGTEPLALSLESTPDNVFYDTDSTTGPAPAIDQHSPIRSSPPGYVSRARLISHNITNRHTLRDLVARTKHIFRVFFLRQRTSYSRIQVTKSLFDTLLTCCHVFPRFKEFMVGFGVRYSEQEIGPPRLQFSPLYSRQDKKCHGFECAYILKYMEFTNRGSGKEPWSFRQTAVYHRYKPPKYKNCSTWILVGASSRAEVRLDRYTRSIPNIQDANPFEIHLIFVDTVLTSWRPYIADLTKDIQQQSDRALLAMVEDNEDFKFLDYDQEQELKQVEDQIVDILVSLDSTLDTITALLNIYEHFNKTFRRDLEGSSIDDWDAIKLTFREKQQDIIYMKQKVEALSSKLQGTKALVSTLLDRANGHTLKLLGEEANQENMIMRQLAEKSNRDSSVVKTLTIITLIYLPATVVSNFYSTQFVTQKQVGDSYAVVYSHNAWLFFAISVPLTIFTLVVWYLWANWSLLLRRKEKWK